MNNTYNIAVKELTTDTYLVSIVLETPWKDEQGNDIMERTTIVSTTMCGDANIEPWVRKQEQRFDISVY